jgi:hypothetical protein
MRHYQGVGGEQAWLHSPIFIPAYSFPNPDQPKGNGPVLQGGEKHIFSLFLTSSSPLYSWFEKLSGLKRNPNKARCSKHTNNLPPPWKNILQIFANYSGWGQTWHSRTKALFSVRQELGMETWRHWWQLSNLFQKCVCSLMTCYPGHQFTWLLSYEFIVPQRVIRSVTHLASL